MNETAPTGVSTSAATTPLMQQYLRIKSEHQGEVLLFRLGDFYEMFYEDAVKAAPILEVALTQRQSVPMCGVPYHAATGYIAKLLKAGLRVAVAEQMEDPKQTKGMVRREVVRVITPGTVLEDALLPSRANNFLLALAVRQKAGGQAAEGAWALAAADVSTGQLWVGSEAHDFHWTGLKARLASLAPTEILLVGEGAWALADVSSSAATVSKEPAPAGAPTLAEQALLAVRAFLARDRSGVSESLGEPQLLPGSSHDTLFLDETAIRHLELVASSDPSRAGPTLLSLLDKGVTSLGSRLLKWWLLHPSSNLSVIESRLDHVEEFLNQSARREELRALLKGVADVERISVRARTGSASPRDLEALRNTLRTLPEIRKVLAHLGDGSERDSFSKELSLSEPSPELLALLETRLADDPPAKLTDGGVIRDGFSPELDELRRFRRSGKSWIAALEAQERGRTGIGSLKIGFNDIFGYFLEVSKSNLAKVPPEWIRKQTMANGERYITPDLKDQEEKILGAEEKIRALETKLFSALVNEVGGFSPFLTAAAGSLAYWDAVSSLAEVAALHGFVRPNVTDSGELVIKAGRHPIIENEIGRDRFIPNDLSLNEREERIDIITGPNMAGKSTYLRQAALIVILAQVGSFVPAESATIGLVDKIFTRIGASDRLAQGQSTFMVEMQEVATLLLNSTGRSLLILDEVGRGTSTYDGMSIAWAVIDHLANRRPAPAPRVLFATHYFELTQLAGKLPGVFNAHATAKEWPGPDGRRRVVFLYQIRPGAADRSYGIHVAEMAGLPKECIDRARDILTLLESGKHDVSKLERSAVDNQLDLFQEHPVVAELRGLRVNELTPLEALNKLSELKDKLS